jgi:mono/diheme cytochrome c family protein
MKRSLNRTLLTTFLLTLGGCASAGTSGSGAAEAPGEIAGATTAEAAVEAPGAAPAAASFTDVQADRGRDLFRGSCTECHYSGEFSDSQFQFKWSRRTAGSLYQLIQTTMPETAPGSLMPEEAVDIVSYILRMNGFDPGAMELAPNREVLDGISLAGIR